MKRKKATNGNGNGLDATAALLQRLAEAGLTVAEARVAVEIARQQKAGEPTNLVTLAKNLKMPISSASRIAWDLCARHGLATQKLHPVDRRIKQLVIVDLERFEQLVHA